MKVEVRGGEGVEKAAWDLLVDLQGLLYPHLLAHTADRREPAVRFLPDDKSTCRHTLTEVSPVLLANGYGTVVDHIAGVLDHPGDPTADAIDLLDAHTTLSAAAGANLGPRIPESLTSRYIEAPQRHQSKAGPAVFLAGGITDCPDWQAAAALMIALRHPQITVFNPRRAEFDTGDPNAEAIQVDWEFEYLRLSDAVIFWFPASQSDQPIALFELGAALEREARISVGADPAWHRYGNLESQIRNSRPDLAIHGSLKDTVSGAAKGFSR